MEKETFSDTIRGLEPRLYRIACGQLRDVNDQADAVQEAILKAWKKLPTLRNDDLFETWLIRILLNECHNLQRAQKRFVPVGKLPDPGYLPEIHSELRETIWNLPDKLRIPVQLYYIEGYDTYEIAEILRVPNGTVCSRLNRARARMKQSLEDD